MTAIVALDAGTGGAKCTVFDLAGRLLARRSERWDYSVVANRDVPMVKEYSFDAEAFWQILARCVRTALAATRRRAARRHRRRHHQPARRLRLPRRRRAASSTPVPISTAAASWRASRCSARSAPQRLYEITGHSAPFIFPLARYLWYRKQGGAPVARILMINDWMTYRLCGVAEHRAVERHRVDAVRPAPPRLVGGDPAAVRHSRRELLPPVFAAGRTRRRGARGGRRRHRACGRHAGVHRRRRHAVLAARRRRDRARRRGGDPRHDDADPGRGRPSRCSIRRRICGPAATSCRSAGSSSRTPAAPATRTCGCSTCWCRRRATATRGPRSWRSANTTAGRSRSSARASST